MSEGQAPTAEPIQPDEHMHIDRLERRWIWLAIVILVIFTIAVSVAGFALGIQVPTVEARVDPTTLGETPPWNEPGLREVVPGEEYDLYMVARQFFFAPDEVAVPAGSTVNIYITSADVQHGIKMIESETSDVIPNVNMMIIPGQVSKVSVTFDEPGVYEYICHEYCGAGHAVMWGRIVVDPAQGGA